jgi:hypothetical protein
MIPGEPPLDASPAEVEQAYTVAFEELQRQENEIADCPTPERKKKKLALNRVQGITNRLLVRLTSLRSSGELEKKITALSDRQDEQAGEIREVRGLATDAGAKAEKACSDVEQMKVALHFLEEGYEAMRKNLDQVDSKQRGKSVIVIGATGVTEKQAVDNLLATKPDMLRDVEEAFYLGKGPGVPIHVTFTTKGSSTKLIAWSHTKDFKDRFGRDVSVVRDRTELRRTGRSRLAAAASQLRSINVNVHQFYDYAMADGKKIDAIEFASCSLVINDTVFDVERACSSSTEYEVSDALFTRVGDVIINGYRKKKRPGPSGGAAGGRNGTNGSGRKRLPNGDLYTSGGVRFVNGANTTHHGHGNALLMGNINDPYDVRNLLSPPRHR